MRIYARPARWTVSSSTRSSAQSGKTATSTPTGISASRRIPSTDGTSSAGARTKAGRWRGAPRGRSGHRHGQCVAGGRPGGGADMHTEDVPGRGVLRTAVTQTSGVSATRTLPVRLRWATSQPMGVATAANDRASSRSHGRVHSGGSPPCGSVREGPSSPAVTAPNAPKGPPQAGAF